MTQVFANLLNNAAKYTDPDGIIRLTATGNGSEVSVSIQDTGVGIDAGIRGQIFELFARAVDSRGRADGGVVEEARAFRPDLLPLDLGMPGVSGQAACRQIREQPWSSRAIIAAVTGWAQEEDRRQTSLAGFDHHLTKPVDPDAWLRLVHTLVARGSNGQEPRA